MRLNSDAGCSRLLSKDFHFLFAVGFGVQVLELVEDVLEEHNAAESAREVNHLAILLRLLDLLFLRRLRHR